MQTLEKLYREYFFFSYTSEKAQSVKSKVSQKRPYKKVTRKTEWLLYGMALFCIYTAQTRPQIVRNSALLTTLFFRLMSRIFGHLAPFKSSFLHLQLHFHSSLFCFGHSQQTFPLHPPPPAPVLILEDICCKHETRDAPTLGPPTYFFFINIPGPIYRGAEKRL